MKYTKHTHIYIFLLFFILVFSWTLFSLSKLDMINILGDEYGYWAGASFFAGLDWSDVTSLNSYYSYGYGMILAILLKLFTDSQIAYKCAIMINAVFFISSCVIAYRCACFVLHSSNKALLMIIAIIVTLYPSNIYFSQTTLCENYLTFLWWGTIYLVLENLYRPRRWKHLLLLMVSILMYYVHHRTIGILVFGIIIELFCLWRNKEKKASILFYILVFGMFFLTFRFVDSRMMDSYYTNKELLSGNTMSGRVSMLTSLINIENMIGLMTSILGQIFYLSVSTFGLFLLSIIYLIKVTYSFTKSLILKKRVSKMAVWHVFLLMAFLLSLGISSLSFIIPARLDQLVYGRYLEYMIGPYLLIALGHLFVIRDNIQLERKIVPIVIIVLLVSVLISYEYANLRDYVFVNNIAISDLYNGDFFGGVVRASVRAIFIWFLIMISLRINCNWSKKGIILVLGVSWCITSIVVLYRYEYPVRKSNQVGNVASYIKSLDDSTKMYYLPAENAGFMDVISIDYLQFLFPKKSIEVLYDYEDVLNIQDGILLLNNKKYPDDLNSNIKIVVAEGEFQVAIPISATNYNYYAEKASELKRSLKLERFEIRNDYSQDDYVVFGPYITLERGDYEAIFGLQLESNNSNLGYCDISANNGETIIARTDFTDEMFENGHATITVPFSLYDNTENIEFRVFAYSGNEIKLRNFYYKQQKDSYTPGLDNADEVQQIAQRIYERNEKLDIVYLNSTESNINLSYLKEVFPEYSISSANLEEISEKNNLKDYYIIADKGYLDWMKLLPDYTVLNQYNNHLLLVSSNAVKTDENTLSSERHADLSLFQKRLNDLYISNVYTLGEGGEYEAILQLPENKDITGDLQIEVLSGEKVLKELYDIKYEKTIHITFDSYEAINDLRFLIYSKDDQKEIRYKTGCICQLKDENHFIYDEQLKPLLDLIPDLNNTIHLISTKWTTEDKRKILQYLNDIPVDFMEYELLDTKDQEKSETLPYSKLSWFIAKPDTPIVYNFLPEYVIAARTDYFVLFIKNEYEEVFADFGVTPLSQETEIFADFFKNVDEEGITNWNISVASGTYALKFNLQISSNYELEDGDIRVKIWGNDIPSRTYALDLDTNQIVISSHIGFTNLHYEILEKYPGIVKTEFAGIEKISDAFEIDLNQMQFYSGEYDAESDCINASSDTIYGPYIDLKAGNYEVSFQYNADLPQSIAFDIAANGGEILVDSSSVTPVQVGDNYEAKLLFSSDEDLEQVEFRTYIPEGVQCVLKAIVVVPKE